MSHRILVVEDEKALADGLCFNLRHEGFEAESVGSAEEGEERLRTSGAVYDLLILDVMLPGKDGFALLSDLRAAGIDVPVLMLTARDGDVDVIRGLELGADDYVTKPFSLGQLVARVRAILRRAASTTADGADRLQIGTTVIDLDGHRIVREDGEVELTATEADILRVIAEAPGRMASRNDILDSIWGPGNYPSTRTVDNHVARIRKKLEDDPAQPRILITVHGVGYRLVVG